MHIIPGQSSHWLKSSSMDWEPSSSYDDWDWEPSYGRKSEMFGKQMHASFHAFVDMKDEKHLDAVGEWKSF